MPPPEDSLRRRIEGLDVTVERWFAEEGPATPDTAAAGWVDLRQAPEDDRALVQQFLIDFGYHPAVEGRSWHDLTDEGMAEGLRAFHLEARSFDSLFQLSLPAGEARIGDEPKDPDRRWTLQDPLVLRPSTLLRIRHLSSLDGTLRLRGLPREGEIDLRSRLLLYRLRLYGLISSRRSTAAPWSGEHLERFQELNRLVVPKSSELAVSSAQLRHWMDDSGNIRKMAGRMAARHRRTGICFRRDRGWEIAAQREANQKLLGSHSWASLPEFGIKSWPSTIRKKEFTRWNRFALRFLQIALWYDGYYQGEIDGEWGTLSLEALENAGYAEGLHYRTRQSKPIGAKGPRALQTRRDQIRFVRKSGIFDTCWVVELDRFLVDLLELDKVAAGEKSKDVGELIAELDRGMAPAFEGAGMNRDERWSHLLETAGSTEEKLSELQPDRPRRRRRRYGGTGAIRRAFIRLGRWFRKAARWAGKLFKTLIGLIRGPLLGILRYLKREALHAVNTARLAIKRLTHAVTGRPYVSVEPGNPAGLVITRFAIDHDAFSISNPEAGERLHEEHRAMIRAQNQALETTGAFAVRVIRLILEFGTPWGWARLAWRIFELFLDWERRRRERRLPHGAPVVA